ncbi:MAG: hypothetical protein R3325_00855 [Thermoanaerobaculia bacterium]|nr:hypothetical protein [Thermoanaerobaculia bacterium]
MSCDTVRAKLIRGSRPGAAELDHLGRCPECALFARRLEESSRLLGRPAGFEPDPSFAPRVAAALPRGPALLGWAALRLIPATVALALVLAGWCLLDTPSPSALFGQGASDDPLAWVLQGEPEDEG